jgi:Putative prokaryotic signal transducing protein
MKRLISSPDSAEIGLLRSRLEAAGIECETRNDYLSPAMPGAPFYPEIWVLKDEKFTEAGELLAAWRQADPPSDTH